MRGVLLSATTGANGGFAFSLARGDGQEVVCRVSASSGGAVARREGLRGGEIVDLTLPAKPPRAEVTFVVPWSADTRLWVYSRARAGAFMCELGRRPPTGVVEERRSLEPAIYVVELFRRTGPDSAEWARLEVDLSNPGPSRARIDPVFEPARSIAGRTRPGARVDWVTRLDDGSTLLRDSTTADTTGRFVLRGVPTTETLLATGSILTPVPPGSDALYEIGELRSG